MFQAAISVLLCVVPMTLYAQAGRLDSSTITQSFGKHRTGELTTVHVSPHALRSGNLTLTTPAKWSELGRTIVRIIQDIDVEYRARIGEYSGFSPSVKLMDSELFYLTTHAPRWTNALFYRGQIILPIVDGETTDIENLVRSVRHEYLHAIVHDLSGGKCPGWLDEGLAQLFEGSENLQLRPALDRWLNRNPPVPFSLLQGGFTRLDAEMVPPAYAQSLYAAREIMDTFGFQDFRSYLSFLKIGVEKSKAFQHAFGLSESSFEHRFGSGLTVSFH